MTKKIPTAILVVLAIAAIITIAVLWGHTDSVRPDENPPAPHQYQVKHGVCTDLTHDGLPVRKCRVIVHGTEWETGYIGRHTDPVKFLKQKVEFSVPR